jgi:hypothetical protein
MLWNYIRLLARDGHILVSTTCCIIDTVHTLAASRHESLLVIDSLHWSLFESQLESLLERAALRKK